MLNIKVWILGIIYVSQVIGVYGVNMWLPQIVKSYSSDLSTTAIGFISAVPFCCTLPLACWPSAGVQTNTLERKVAYDWCHGSCRRLPGFCAVSYKAVWLLRLHLFLLVPSVSMVVCPSFGRFLRAFWLVAQLQRVSPLSMLSVTWAVLLLRLRLAG